MYTVYTYNYMVLAHPIHLSFFFVTLKEINKHDLITAYVHRLYAYAIAFNKSKPTLHHATF